MDVLAFTIEAIVLTTSFLKLLEEYSFVKMRRELFKRRTLDFPEF